MPRNKYWLYVDWIGPSGIASRLDAANHFNVRKETALYHLEVARAEGWLERKIVECDGFQQGYGYYWSEASHEVREGQLELAGFEAVA